MKRGILSLLTLLVITLLLAFIACAPTAPSEVQPPTSPPVEEPQPEPQEPEKPPPPPVFPITVTDDIGRTVTIEKLPERIVSLGPGITEILFALGLGDRVVGVTDYCDYPEEAKTKPRVGGFSTPDLERLVATKPDLVLAGDIQKTVGVPAMENLGLTVVTLAPKTLDGVLNNIALVGEIAGKSQEASELVAQLKERIRSVIMKTETLTGEQRPRVLYVLWHDPIWSAGRETFIGDLIVKAGGVNIFADDFEEFRVVSLEAVITKNPQVVIVSSMGLSGDVVYTSVKKEARLSTVEAMVKNHVYKISDADLIELPGPRIVDGLEEVAKLIHPEIFGAVE